MGNLKFGNNAPLALYMGVSGATKAYYGTEVVFEGGSPTPIDYSKEYLTFDIVSAGTITYSNTHFSFIKTISYSVNNSEWLSGNSFSLNVNSGDKIRFKGTNTAYNNKTDNRCGFGGTATFNIVGNILSLTYGDNFTGNTQISASYAFSGLFMNTSVISAENLILPNNATIRCYYETFQGCTLLTTAPKLPATTLYDYSYYYMFYGCTSLTAAPELPATTLADGCYGSMFRNCTSLSYIKCLATDASGTSHFNYWCFSVPSGGTFEGYASAGWTTGASGIPKGWTFVEASS